MKTEWYENEHKYKEGDIILFHSQGTFNETAIVGMIKAVHSKPFTQAQRDSIELENKEARDCCGRQSRRKGNNFIYYELQNGAKVFEGGIRYSGIDEINNLLAYLRRELQHSKRKSRNAALALGIDEYNIRD